jgi:hypothetical protein
MRNADDLSRQTAPLRTACGTSSREAAASTAKRKTSTAAAANDSGVASSTGRPSSAVPADRADANRRTS